MKIFDRMRASLGSYLLSSAIRNKTGASSFFDAIFRSGADTLGFKPTITEPFKQHPTIYRAMIAFARNVARLPFEVFTTGTDDNLPDHPFVKLLEKPNATMRGTQLMEVTVLHLEHWGNALWRLGEATRVSQTQKMPLQILLLPPQRTKPILDNDGMIVRYDVNKKGRVEKIPADEVVHFRYSSPYSDVWGQSWVDPARSEFETDFMAQNWNKGFFHRGADPGGVITVKDDYALIDEDVERLRTQWVEKHGGLARGHAPAILPKGLEFKTTGIGQREMDFVALRNNSRDNVLVAAGLPPALASVLQFANYANMQPQLRIFFELELMPRLKYIESVIQADILDKFNLGVDGFFKTEAIMSLLEDLNQKADIATKFFNLGIPLAELNDRLELGFNLEDAPAAETSFLPFSVTPAEDVIGDDEPEGSEPTPPPDPNAEPLIGDDPLAEPDESALQFTKSKYKSEQMRERVWRTLIQTTRDLVSKGESRYRDHLHSLFKEMMANLPSANQKRTNGSIKKRLLVNADIDRILFDGDNANQEVVLRFEPLYRQSMSRANKTVEQQTGLAIDFRFNDPAVIGQLVNRRAAIKATNVRMQKDLRVVMARGVQNGEPEEVIARRVQKYFKGQRSNARTIARTEVHASFTAGRNESMVQAGIKVHEWLSSRDSSVRDDHAIEDGSVTPIGETFPITGLMYPLDPSGDAGQVINCRCVTVPIVTKDTGR